MIRTKANVLFIDRYSYDRLILKVGYGLLYSLSHVSVMEEDFSYTLIKSKYVDINAKNKMTTAEHDELVKVISIDLTRGLI
jgi:hypothetical protein